MFKKIAWRCDKNMQKFKKTFKKVAAVGTGVAMLGMTLTGAMAVDLSNYPSGLGFGGSDTIIIVGANAGDSASDNAAASDVASGLPATTLGGGGVLVEGGVDEDVPLGVDSLFVQSALHCRLPPVMSWWRPTGARASSMPFFSLLALQPRW